MPDKLSIFNGCLRILKSRRLSALTDNRETRRLLDDIWADGRTEGAVQYCLQMGQWTFARRTVQLDYSPSVEPDFGYRYAFDQPLDMVRPAAIYTDEGMITPLLRYVDERKFWYCPLPTIYVTYVSDDVNYGGDMSLWPEVFAKLVEAYLAREIAPNLTNGTDMIQIANAAYVSAKKEAMSDDAMRQPTRFSPPGGWTLARHGNSYRSSWSRGN